MKRLIPILAGLLMLVFASGAYADDYTDPAGDSGGAADITKIGVGVTPQDRLLVFDITVANRDQNALLPDDKYAIWLDTDADRDTGAPNDFGAEYLMVLEGVVLNGVNTGHATLSRWTSDEGFVEVTADECVGVGDCVYILFNNGVIQPSMAVLAENVGNPTRLNFHVLSGGEAITGSDNAPDRGTYRFAYTPRCSNGQDDDGDGATDADDPGCEDALDNDETNSATLPLCADGLDNDFDGLLDYPEDPGCEARGNGSESPNPGCTLEGTLLAEDLIGTEDDDGICAFAGNDTISGLAGDDEISAGPDDDTARGGLGRDLIRGGGGRDTLLGNRGRDSLRGGRGADILRGGRGRDSMRGGRGADRFYARDGRRDVIRCGRGRDVVVTRDAVDVLIGC
jgi:Ca2+-binding RTX toxin-like protein